MRGPTMTMDRATLDSMVFEAALEQARKSLREGGLPIGSALMDPRGTIVALGHNQRVQTGDPTAHAETVCIRNAGRRRDWHELTLATTLSPCAMCSGTAVLYRIPRLVIGEHTTFLGREDWLRHERVEIVLMNDQRCIDLMQAAIRDNPGLWNEDIGVPDEIAPESNPSPLRGHRS
ncbi:MAG: nucleoside deaminase [Phycisphaeraceae bacterium]|nr:nucleoside deaminase [Phycisphaeraceae bacterium]